MIDPNFNEIVDMSLTCIPFLLTQVNGKNS